MKKVVVLSLLLGVSLSLADIEAGKVYVVGKRLNTIANYTSNKSAEVTVISEQEIQNSGAKDLTQLLSMQSGFASSSQGIYGKENLSLRGYADKSGVIVLVDGVKQNDLNNDTVMWAAIPLDNIESIEIIRGGGSVIYGAGAVAGVINIITKKATDKISLKAGYEQGDYQTYKKTGYLQIPIISNLLHLAGNYFDNQGNLYRQNSAFQNENNQIQLVIGNPDVGEIRLLKNQGRAVSQIPGELLEAGYLNTPNMSNNDSSKKYTELNSDTAVQLEYPNLFGGHLAFKYYDKLRNQDSKLFVDAFADMKKTGLVSQYELPIEFFGIKNNLILGYEYTDDSIDSGYTGINTGNLVGKTNSAYLSSQLALGWLLALDMGYRLDDITYTYSDLVVGSDMFWNPIYESGEKKMQGSSPMLGITLFPGQDLELFANYNSSFKVPPYEDFAVFSPSYNANTAIKPQINNSIESGFKLNLFNVGSIEGNSYISEITDEILYNDTSYLNENFNTKHSGYSAKIHYQLFENLTLETSYEKDEAELKSASSGTMLAGRKIPNIPEYLIKTYLVYNLAADTFVKLSRKDVGSYFPLNDYAGLNKQSGYIVYNLNLQSKLAGFRIYGGVNNLLNTKYSELNGLNWMGKVTYYPVAERNYYFGMEFEI